MKFEIDRKKLPAHIAFIMDGNGRWAKKHLLPRSAGHAEGVRTIKKILEEAFDLGIPYVSLYAFSTENTKREQAEVEGLIKLLRENLKDLLSQFIERGIRLNIMGDIEYFPQDVRYMLRQLLRDSRSGKAGMLNLGLNYGARAEIIRAVNLAIEAGKPVTEQTFASLLYTADIPDPDLIVRTSGEQRLSNFMLYQSAYSELCFTDVLWPDFNKKALHEILGSYAKRNRRYGR